MKLSLPPGLATDSLAFRLYAATALWTFVVLPLTGILLYSLYRVDIEDSFDKRLALSSTLLITVAVGQDADKLDFKDFGEDLYIQPLSGYYWQIATTDAGEPRTQSSASLVGDQLVFPDEEAKRQRNLPIRIATTVGPDGAPIKMVERSFELRSAATGMRRFSFIITGSLAESNARIANFRDRLTLALSALAIGLLLATYAQVRYVLRPLDSVGRGLAAIRSGGAKRLEGEFPREVRPLQRQLNAMIKSNEEIIERARTHVGNLAHALKTPLSVITNEAQLEKGALAKKVVEQAAIMRQQVNHHLDRARMVARTGSIADVTEVKPIADALVRVLGRIYAERGIALRADCPASLRFRGEKQDLEEMLGNLMDNACKWAKGRVTLSARSEAAESRGGEAHVVVVVDDDGPGLDEEQRAAAVKRGRRLDETKPGSGLGLSIVADLVALYGGTFALDRSGDGGLRATLALPAA